MRKLVLGLLLALPGAASANFHFMQIEQVIGGVNGDTTQQAVQLRMRLGGQNVVSQAQVVAVDVNGANPVVLVDMTTDVTMNVTAGSRILIASPNFIAQQGVTADFTMTNLIPSGYLAGGQVQFLHDLGTRYWLVCWGTYAGSVTGNTTNDPDGNFGPCEPSALPSSGLGALLFTGAASASSTNNSADYATTAGAAVFTNNAGTQFTIIEPPLFANGFE